MIIVQKLLVDTLFNKKDNIFFGLIW